MKNVLEKWKDIVGYEGLYQVSSKGRVKSLTRFYTRTFRGKEIKQSIRGRIIKPVKHGNGYLYVTLNKNKKRQNLYIHRLVAEAFIPKLKDKNHVNHKDHIRSNNTVENLEWVTIEENLEYSRHLGLHPRKSINNKEYGIRLKGKKYEVGINHRYLGRFNTYEEAEKVRNEYLEKHYH